MRNATSKLPVSPLCLLLAAFFHLRRRRGKRRGRGKSTNGRLYRHGTILHSIRGGSREGMNVKFEFHSSFNFILAFFLNVFFCSRIENAFIHLLPRYLDGILFSFLIFAWTETIRVISRSSFERERTMGTIGITDVGGVKRCKEAE